MRDLIARVAPTGAAVLIHGEAGTGKEPGRPPAARPLRPRRRAWSASTSAAWAPTPPTPSPGRRRGAGRHPVPRRGRRPRRRRPRPGCWPYWTPARTCAWSPPPARRARAWPPCATTCSARLNTVEVFLPGLAARGEDLTLLLEHFVRLFARRYGRPPKPLDPSAVELLRIQPPPGQVRGLRQAAERAVVLSDGDILTAADFAPPTPGAGRPAGAPDLNLARSERAIVEAALKRHGHNVSHAARDLGLTRAALYRRMVKHGL